MMHCVRWAFMPSIPRYFVSFLLLFSLILAHDSLAYMQTIYPPDENRVFLSALLSESQDQVAARAALNVLCETGLHDIYWALSNSSEMAHILGFKEVRVPGSGRRYHDLWIKDGRANSKQERIQILKAARTKVTDFIRAEYSRNTALPLALTPFLIEDKPGRWVSNPIMDVNRRAYRDKFEVSRMLDLIRSFPSLQGVRFKGVLRKVFKRKGEFLIPELVKAGVSLDFTDLAEVPIEENISVLAAFPEYKKTQQILLRAIEQNHRTADQKWLDTEQVQAALLQMQRDEPAFYQSAFKNFAPGDAQLDLTIAPEPTEGAGVNLSPNPLDDDLSDEGGSDDGDSDEWRPAIGDGPMDDVDLDGVDLPGAGLDPDHFPLLGATKGKQTSCINGAGSLGKRSWFFRIADFFLRGRRVKSNGSREKLN